jgi:hypothetical protein
MEQREVASLGRKVDQEGEGLRRFLGERPLLQM